MLTYTGYLNRFTDWTQNNTSTNQTRGMQLINDAIRYCVQKYYFNEQQFQTLTVANQQVYNLPFDAKDVINETVLVGGILWQPLEAPNRQFWDSLNTIPFYSDFPQFFYRFKASQLQLFPIPTSDNDPIQINYKRRIKDLSIPDYTTGTVSVNQWKSGGLVFTANSANISGTTLSYTPILANGDQITLKGTGLPSGFTSGSSYYVVNTPSGIASTTNAGNTDFTVQLSATSGGSAIVPTTSAGTSPMQGGPIISYEIDGSKVTGSGTTFTNLMQDRWFQIPEANGGDGRWYQIGSYVSGTEVKLYDNYRGPTVSSADYIIGEAPILPEDYQDIPLYRALWIYYNTIVPEPGQAKMFQEMYETQKQVLDYEFGSKTTNPVLTPPNAPTFNPNLFPRITS